MVHPILLHPYYYRLPLHLPPNSIMNCPFPVLLCSPPISSQLASHLSSLILNKTSERQDGVNRDNFDLASPRQDEGEGERTGRSKNRPTSTTSPGVGVWQALRKINKVVSVIIEPLVIVNPFLNVGSGSLVPQPSS